MKDKLEGEGLSSVSQAENYLDGDTKVISDEILG